MRVCLAGLLAVDVERPGPGVRLIEFAKASRPIGDFNPVFTVTTPGSFALAADIGGPRMFSSPDTPGMPEVSPFTAWDFLPAGWSLEIVNSAKAHGVHAVGVESVVFTDARNITHRVTFPVDFAPITQLEHARLGRAQLDLALFREPDLFPRVPLVLMAPFVRSGAALQQKAQSDN
jgi:hypothetical protein